MLYLGDATEIMPHLPPAGMVMTSPPYATQRTYGAGRADDWDALVPPVLSQMPLADNAQVLVVLGLVRRHVLVRYWDSLIAAMDAAGRPLTDWYVWDKLNGRPGDYSGRLVPEHEWVFHFRRGIAHPARTLPCKDAGKKSTKTVRKADGMLYASKNSGRVRDRKTHGSVFRHHPLQSNAERTGHPAQMPVHLAADILSPWPTLDPVVDPFGGAGTTCVAALQACRRCIQIERVPEYHALACARIERAWAEISG